MATKWIEPSDSGVRSASEPSVECCPTCGALERDRGEAVAKRGAVTIAFDPLAVWWRGKYVPLSPVEALVFAFVARRGRVLLSEIDEEMAKAGAKPATRTLVMGYIRRKFLALGACDPFERLGNRMVRLQVDADETGSTAMVIGRRMPRYACVTPLSAND